MLELLSFWNIIVLAQAIFAILLLFFLIRITRRNKIFFPLLVFAVLALIDAVILILSYTDWITAIPHAIDSNEPFFLLHGLLFFLYIRNLLHQNSFFRKKDLLFFLPFVLSFLIYLPFFLKSAQTKLVGYATENPARFSAEIWEWLFYFLVNVYFLYKALQLLKLHNSNQKKQLSDIEKSNLGYTHKLIQIYIALLVLEFVLIYSTFLGFAYFEKTYLILYFLNGIVLLLIALDAVIHHKYILESQEALKTSSVPKEMYPEQEGSMKYARSGLTQKSIETIEQELLRFMDEKKPFLTPKLRIRDLSELTNIPAHHISQVINESFHQNFYEFINTYRIKEAMLILKNPKYQNYTYEAIAFEVGFNSRSAFYTAFKKIYHTTPTQYLNKHKQ